MLEIRRRRDKIKQVFLKNFAIDEFAERVAY